MRLRSNNSANNQLQSGFLYILRYRKCLVLDPNFAWQKKVEQPPPATQPQLNLNLNHLKTNWTSSQQSTQLTTTSTTNSTQLTTTSTTNSTQLTTTSTTNSTQLTTTSTTNPPTLPSNFSLKNSRKPLVGAVPSSYKVRQTWILFGPGESGSGRLVQRLFFLRFQINLKKKQVLGCATKLVKG